MATPVFASGFFATMAIGTNELPVIEWSLARTRTLVEFKNSQTGIYPFRDPTFGDIIANVSIDRDFANNPNAAPYNILPGTTLVNCNFYERQTAKDALNGPVHVVSAMIISSAPVKCQVNGKDAYSFTAAINGTYTPPTS